MLVHFYRCVLDCNSNRSFSPGRGPETVYTKPGTFLRSVLIRGPWRMTRKIYYVKSTERGPITRRSNKTRKTRKLACRTSVGFYSRVLSRANLAGVLRFRVLITEKGPENTRKDPKIGMYNAGTFLRERALACSRVPTWLAFYNFACYHGAGPEKTRKSSCRTSVHFYGSVL